MVVGDLIGSGSAQEQAIVGETPNLAARLQGVAEPNSVVVAESTRKLVGNLFELEDLGPKDLKGITGPVRAWAALRASSSEGRFEAMHAAGLTDLVGREEELELLLRRWSKAKTGEGQVVLLSGEPGIGKSRLTAALLQRLADERHTGLRYFCSPQHTDSAFYPIISQMERAAEFAHDDTAQAKLDKLDAVLAQSFTSRQDAALFAEMLSLPNDGCYQTLELTPQQRRQQTLEALTTQIEALSRPADAVQMINSGITAWRSLGSKLWMPNYLSYLARAYAEIGQLNDAWRCICEAMTAVETTKEGLWEAEIHRMAGEIALLSSQPDAAKAQDYFEHALAVARQQQAKSWELRRSGCRSAQRIIITASWRSVEVQLCQFPPNAA